MTQLSDAGEDKRLDLLTLETPVLELGTPGEKTHILPLTCNHFS